jgi:hypothetical protein
MTMNGNPKLPTATGGAIDNVIPLHPEQGKEGAADQVKADGPAGAGASTTDQVNTGTNLVPVNPPDPDAVDAAATAKAAQVRKEWVVCKLTTAQRSELATEMSDLLRRRDELADDRKEAGRHYREEIKVLDEKLRQARRGVTSGEMNRHVEVRDEVHDLKMATVRVDTGATVRTRNLTDAERQHSLKLATADSAEETGVGRKARGPRKTKGKGKDVAADQGEAKDGDDADEGSLP